MADIFGSQKRSEIMSKVRSRDTNIEILLRKALFARGYRFRIHYRVFGRPDIVFPGKKIAIFCDGDFWHGKNFKKERGGYKRFWVEKIGTNLHRDRNVNKYLRKHGWTVLRFWKSDILRSIDGCITKIELSLKEL